MALHEDLGVAPDQTSSVTGHSSTATQIIYKRMNINTSKKVSAKLNSAISGQKIEVPEDNCVLLQDGTVSKIRQFLVPVSDNADDCEANLALGSMSLDEFYQNVPDDEENNNDG